MAFVIGLDQVIDGGSCVHLLLWGQHYVPDLWLYIFHISWGFNSKKSELLLYSFAKVTTPYGMICVLLIDGILQRCISVG